MCDMKSWAVCLLLVFPLSGSCQIRQVVSGETLDREERQRQEFGDLYKRLSASRFVVVGTVLEYGLVSERGAPPSIDSHIGGSLYTIGIERTLCRHEDFASRTTGSPSIVPKEVQIFVPYRPMVYGKEHLEPGQRYLLFLVVPEQKDQNEWTHDFDLDPKGIYYRGEELARGVILLPKAAVENPNPEQFEVLDKVTKLCTAVSVPELTQKLLELNQLAASADPVLKKEAVEALTALQSSQQ